jgi:CRP-like cAMP-binding protein
MNISVRQFADSDSEEERSVASTQWSKREATVQHTYLPPCPLDITPAERQFLQKFIIHWIYKALERQQSAQQHSFTRWRTCVADLRNAERRIALARLQQGSIAILQTTKPGQRSEAQIAHLSSYFAQAAPFAALTEQQLTQLAQGVQWRCTANHTTLFHQGDAAQEVFFIVRGMVRLCTAPAAPAAIAASPRNTPAQTPSLEVAFAKSGQLLGELGVHHSCPRALTATAVSSVEACVISAALYDAVLREGFAKDQVCSNRVALLQQSGLFAELGTEHLTAIAFRLRPRQCPRRCVLARSGTPLTALFFIGQYTYTSYLTLVAL